MKTKMLIFVFLLGITDLFAQTLYVPGAIVKGKNASYYCAFENKLVVKSTMLIMWILLQPCIMMMVRLYHLM